MCRKTSGLGDLAQPRIPPPVSRNPLAVSARMGVRARIVYSLFPTSGPCAKSTNNSVLDRVVKTMYVICQRQVCRPTSRDDDVPRGKRVFIFEPILSSLSSTNGIVVSDASRHPYCAAATFRTRVRGSSSRPFDFDWFCNAAYKIHGRFYYTRTGSSGELSPSLLLNIVSYFIRRAGNAESIAPSKPTNPYGGVTEEGRVRGSQMSRASRLEVTKTSKIPPGK